jgi:hypothetical protein
VVLQSNFAGLEAIGIIFSSLVVAPLPDKSDSFRQEQSHQQLDWLFSSIDISLVTVFCEYYSVSSEILLVLASPP